ADSVFGGTGRAVEKSALYRRAAAGSFVAGKCITNGVIGYRVKIKKSPIHGRGVFADEKIPARRKIGEMTGAIITVREARRRAKQRGAIALVEFSDGWAVDGFDHGNAFARINHSCTPNAWMRVYGHHVEFYARRVIRVGEEITCDYVESHHDGKLRCRCGAKRCRGSI
ncbi:MAG TPA: SET domain-containing protein, partial [bacterium]|nr:SET domain-containing protein [bacterium]